MAAQPLDDSRFSDRELIGVLAERVGGMRDTFDDFRAETRGNFDAAKAAVAALKAELKTDTAAIRTEMTQRFAMHDTRIKALEDTKSENKGAYLSVKFIIALVALGPVSAAIIWLAEK